MRSALILICALGATCLSCAQSKPKSWTNLNALHEGDKIQILEVDHQAISGSFQNATEDSLSVQNKAGAQTIRKQDIRSVRLLKNTHGLRNTLIGAGIGAGAGAGVTAGVWESNGFLGNKGDGAAVGAVIGTVIGVTVGALSPSHPTIYAMGAP